MTAQVGELHPTWDQVDDAVLLDLARTGDAGAYGELWRRHLPAAYGVAHRYRNRASAEDIVAEAAARVYALIKAGKGPQTNFRSYFLTTVRTAATDTARTDLRVVPTEGTDLELAAGSVEAHDPTVSVDHEMVRAAFNALPERDQRVLWFTTVEGESPSKVAATMGMSANGVSVTALRAKDTLRARYLDAHATRAISRADDDECRWVLSNMGRYVRGKLPTRQKARVDEHLRVCRHAQTLAYEMADVSRGLPAVIVPFIFLGALASKAAWVVVPSLVAAGATEAGVAGVDAGGSSGSSKEQSSAAAGAVAGLGSPGTSVLSGAAGSAGAAGAAGAAGSAGAAGAAAAAAGAGAGAAGGAAGLAAIAGSPAGMVALALVAVAGLTVVAATQLPKVLGHDAQTTSSEGGAAPAGPQGASSNNPGGTSGGGTTTRVTAPTSLPTSASTGPVVWPPASQTTHPTTHPTAPSSSSSSSSSSSTTASSSSTTSSTTSSSSSTTPSSTTTSPSSTTTTPSSTTTTPSSTTTTPSSTTTTTVVPVRPSVTVGTAAATGTADQVAIPVTIDPGTTTGAYVVRVSSAAAADLSASGSGWTCVVTTTDPALPSLECTRVVAAPAVPQGAVTLPVLSVLVTSNQAGPVDVAVLVDGASQASAQTLLPEAAPTVVVSQAVQASGGTQLITDLTGRFATLPAMWVWWVDDLGAVSVPAADPTDEWLCRPASSGRPTSIPKSADKCSFMGDPRRLTSLRYTTKDSAHHVLHVVVDIGGILTETTVDVPIP